jgi:hypothetical protein
MLVQIPFEDLHQPLVVLSTSFEKELFKNRLIFSVTADFCLIYFSEYPGFIYREIWVQSHL